MLIDTHAHLDLAEFDHDRKALFQKMQGAGISGALIPAISPSHWQKQLQVAKEYRCLYALGIHPWYVTEDVEQQLQQLIVVLNKQKQDNGLVALGECGLDKIRSENWSLQLLAFEQQIAMAIDRKLPLIIHSVRAHNEVLTLLLKYKPPMGGIIHGYYGSLEIAEQYYKLGFKLGIGGLLLNDNAKKLRHTVQNLPINAFVVETDSPSMLPQKCDEQRNTPLLINEIVTKIADLHEESAVLISKQLQGSFCQVVDIGTLL